MNNKDLEYFQKGINRFNEISYKRNLKDPKIIWERNGVKLRKYRNRKTYDNIILLIPSILNNYYILDLARRNSFARDLAKSSSVYIIDWSCSDQNINSFEDYINICNQIISFIANKDKISIIGYCLGGIIAIACSIICKDYIDRICLISTPWDFSKLTIINRISKYIYYNYNEDIIPGGVIYNIFCQLQYTEFIKKYIKFAKIRNKSKINLFLSIENWLQNKDGYMRTSILNDILHNFFIKNKLCNNQYYVSNHLIDLNLIQKNILIVIPENDKIVQKESSIILTEKIKYNQTLNIDSGHIAMVTNGRYRKFLIDKINEFLII